MADTQRTDAELLASFADNNIGGITAQDIRDLVVSKLNSTALTDHELLADPHPQYETSSEAQAKVDAHAALTGTSVHGLGTASTADVTTSSTDTTSGRLLKVGDFGVGGIPYIITDCSDPLTQPGFYSLSNSTNAPFTGLGSLIHNQVSHQKQQIAIERSSSRIWVRSQSNSVPILYTPWQEIYHTGNAGTAVTADVVDNLISTSATDVLSANQGKVLDEALTAHENATGTAVHGLGTASTATLTTSATDATVGRVLKTGDFGVGAPIAVGAIDFDTLLQAGVYGIYIHTDWNNSLNRPSQDTNQQCTIIVSNRDNATIAGICQQVFTEKGKAFFRTSSWSGVFTPWKEIYHTGNILGTVSATGTYPNLVPTGAIMESGSNANGEYIKYADGTMICTQKRLIDLSDISTSSITDKWAAAGGLLPAVFSVVTGAFFSMPRQTYNATAIQLLTECSVAAITTATSVYPQPSATYVNASITRYFTVVTFGRWK